MATGIDAACRLGRLLFLHLEGRQMDWKGQPVFWQNFDD